MDCGPKYKTFKLLEVIGKYTHDFSEVKDFWKGTKRPNSKRTDILDFIKTKEIGSSRNTIKRVADKDTNRKSISVMQISDKMLMRPHKKTSSNK